MRCAARRRSISGIGTGYFDFGVPFFYGRTVFTGMVSIPGVGLQTTTQALVLRLLTAAIHAHSARMARRAGWWSSRGVL